MWSDYEGSPPPGYVRDECARAWFRPDPDEQVNDLIVRGRQALASLVPEKVVYRNQRAGGIAATARIPDEWIRFGYEFARDPLARPHTFKLGLR